LRRFFPALAASSEMASQSWHKARWAFSKFFSLPQHTQSFKGIVCFPSTRHDAVAQDSAVSGFGRFLEVFFLTSRSVCCADISMLFFQIRKNVYILEKDQLWQLADSQIIIVSVGRHLTHFKHCKTADQKRVTTQVESIVEMQKYLKDHHGKLVRQPHVVLEKAA
jgi:hypothetical protein